MLMIKWLLMCPGTNHLVSTIMHEGPSMDISLLKHVIIGECLAMMQLCPDPNQGEDWSGSY
jgi:hypothetical protein